MAAFEVTTEARDVLNIHCKCSVCASRQMQSLSLLHTTIPWIGFRYKGELWTCLRVGNYHACSPVSWSSAITLPFCNAVKTFSGGGP